MIWLPENTWLVPPVYPATTANPEPDWKPVPLMVSVWLDDDAVSGLIDVMTGGLTGACTSG